MHYFRSFTTALLIGTLVFGASCDNDHDDAKPAKPDDDFTVDDWTDVTHGKTDPDYSTVFPQEKVNTITIRMTESDWSEINKDAEPILGNKFGSSRPGGGGRRDLEFGPDPKYVAVSLHFSDRQWYKVGFRLKGNSSLMISWAAGIYKLPFRLKFDEFEETWPQINDQRFFGFQELSFAPAVFDNSLIREKFGSDIFRAAGVPAAMTSFYRVFIDFGSGTQYCGVYTLVEVIDDTMVKNSFGSDDGNIYKPMSNFQIFVPEQFEKKNNTELGDYSDVIAVINALYDPLRQTDPQAWRALLEEHFNVDHFLRWLAVSTIINNWDSYGMSAHNYYLYNDPGKGITWIPWDNNMIFPGPWGQIDLTHQNVPDYWPLIRFLIDDPVYNLQYREHVEAVANGAFEQSVVNAMLEKYHTMIKPFVVGPANTESGRYTHLTDHTSFEASVQEMKDNVAVRHQDINAFLQ